MKGKSRMLGAIVMLGRTHAFGVGLFLVVATSPPALAQSSSASKGEPYPTCTKKVEAAESEAAHAKYLSGKVDYDEGKHEAAIQQFKQAYQKDCTKHELLVIISRAYEFKADYAEAIRALETYLERVPGSPDAATHRSRIETLKGKLADQRAAAAASAQPTGGSSTTTGPSTTPPGADAQGHTVYPWILVGVGGAAVLGGAIFLAAKPNTGCDLDTEKCTRREGESDADFKDRQADAGVEKAIGTWAPVAVVGGAILVAGGLVWHFLEPVGPTNSGKTKLQPQVGPGFGGFSLTRRF